jgi:hypothetical protein
MPMTRRWGGEMRGSSSPCRPEVTGAGLQRGQGALLGFAVLNWSKSGMVAREPSRHRFGTCQCWAGVLQGGEGPVLFHPLPQHTLTHTQTHTFPLAAGGRSTLQGRMTRRRSTWQTRCCMMSAATCLAQCPPQM